MVCQPETWCCLRAATGCLLLGYDTGVIAGAILLIIPEFALEDKPGRVGLVVSSCVMGALVGTLIAGPTADAFGRRPPLIGAGILFILGGAAMGWSPCFEVSWTPCCERARAPLYKHECMHACPSEVIMCTCFHDKNPRRSWWLAALLQEWASVQRPPSSRRTFLSVPRQLAVALSPRCRSSWVQQAFFPRTWSCCSASCAKSTGA
jgi:MFS family permease